MTPISQMEMLHRARKVEKVISARGRLSSLSSQQFARTHNLKINGQLCSYSLNQICFPVFLLLLIGVIFNIYIRELKHGTVLGSNNRMKSLTIKSQQHYAARVECRPVDAASRHAFQWKRIHFRRVVIASLRDLSPVGIITLLSQGRAVTAGTIHAEWVFDIWASTLLRSWLIWTGKHLLLK